MSSIVSGTRLGPYEIVAPLGAGGMGEVWKARDTRLDRSVAIKVLPHDFAENVQLKLRFEREAKTISQLNHPHICTLYDVGDGYLVMELLEGESLADKLSSGPLPVDQVLRYGSQIAEALEKAHKAGVVHRDLKPANIMITKSGAKLLDFGLAKPTEGAGAISALTSLRTEHKKALTEEGVIVGTFQYMAPEQIEGAEVDARTDIFALGVVLYEMAAGHRAFEGKTKASLIASILTAEPAPITAAQPMTPAMLDRVVRKCLEKDPDQRWQSAQDIATELRWVGDTHIDATREKSHGDRLAWLFVAALITAACAFAFLWRRAASAPVQRVQAFLLPPADFEYLSTIGAPALSPDGRRLAFAARSRTDSKAHVFIQRLDDGSRFDVGLSQVAMPFWSPDSQEVAVFSPVDHKLFRINAAGGPPQVICDLPRGRGRGGTWNRDGVILFSPGSARHGIFRVNASGGTPVEITKVATTDLSHGWPSFLPDGRHYLYASQAPGGSGIGRLYAGALDSNVVKEIAPTPYPAFYSVATGQLLYCRGRALIAQPFDLGRLELRGEPVVVSDSVRQLAAVASAGFSVSDNGMLALFEGGPDRARIVWRDRGGKEIGALTDIGDYVRPALSHDGRRLAYEVNNADGTSDIWVYDVAHANATRLTFEEGTETNAVWSADDQFIAYAAADPKTGSRAVMRRRSSGAGVPEKIFEASNGSALTDWSADGTRIFFHDGGDVFAYSSTDKKIVPVIATPFSDCCARLSPDGKWLTYASDRTGRSEIYIEPFPNPTAVYKVSSLGGTQPRWVGHGQELVYDSLDYKIMSVPLRINGAALDAGTPVELFAYRYKPGGWSYDVAADGQRFVTNEEAATDAVVPLTIVVNWNGGAKH